METARTAEQIADACIHEADFAPLGMMDADDAARVEARLREAAEALREVYGWTTYAEQEEMADKLDAAEVACREVVAILESIEQMAGAAGSGEVPAMPIAKVARVALAAARKGLE